MNVKKTMQNAIKNFVRGINVKDFKEKKARIKRKERDFFLKKLELEK